MSIARLRFRAILVPICALASLFAAGCGNHIDKITDINDNPGKYLHHNVTVAGRVTQVYGLPLGISNLAAYRIDDGTGQIWVISHDGPPTPGQEFGVKGTLEPMTNLNLGVLGNPFGNSIEESERQPIQ